VDPATGADMVGTAARHRIHAAIDPADTRDVVNRFVAPAPTRIAIGRRRLVAWPITF
jgi:hypothetical protein